MKKRCQTNGTITYMIGKETDGKYDDQAQNDFGDFLPIFEQLLMWVIVAYGILCCANQATCHQRIEYGYNDQWNHIIT